MYLPVTSQEGPRGVINPDGACTGIDDDCLVTVMGPTSVTANFGAPSGHTVTVDQTGSGQGTVTSSPAGINCVNAMGRTSTQTRVLTVRR